MRSWRIAISLVVLLMSLSTVAFGKSEPERDPLDMYQVTVDAAQLRQLVRDGYDVAATRQVAGGIQVDLVLSGTERARLEGEGLHLGLLRNRDGLTARQLAAEQAEDGYTVWRSFDEPGGIRDEMYQIAQQYPGIAKLVVVGHSIQGREILALRITAGARGLRDGARPAVLYSSAQHAREWISVEVNRRLLHHFVDNYGRNREVTDLVNTRELWFVLVANPDGYQYTFEAERLWRKNLRDNDGDGQITNTDGVDPNRNFAEHWNYDNEGSASQPSDLAYRGASAASEPETQAMQGLLGRIGFEFQVNYHSYGNLLLYSFGWQVQTPSTDDPIFVALSGTDENPAIQGYNPGVGADLYTTNGETTDYAHAITGTLAWTPELGEGVPGNEFNFPDDPALVQQEFAINLPFALDVAKSAKNPAQPVSHLGNATQPFYLDPFAVSYGDPQIVQVNAARHLGAVTLKYRINGGAVQSTPTSEWQGGERYGDVGDIYYHMLRGQVTGTEPGDDVEVWFEGGRTTSPAFTYQAAVESDAEVLVLAAEDYTGLSPVYSNTSEPNYLAYYLDALNANGIAADVYDVDANGRKAPDALGVLSHYRAVIWYTGNDVITREPGMGPGTASRLANDEMLEMRAYLNEGGRLLYTGKYAGLQYADAFEFDLVANAPCDSSSGADGCVPLSDDFLQYYLGAYMYNDDAGTTPDGGLFDVAGVDTPFAAESWFFNGPDSADNQDHSASFVATSGILPAESYPQFTSSASAKYVRAGGPFDPHTGEYYVYSQIGDASYKRLTHTFDVPASGASVSFWVSRDTEPDWDFMFVEAHTVGQDDWTTLPDSNGHTSTSVGDSCAEGWHELHPFLEHYQTVNADGSCSATGTTGDWHAASGNSGGWEQWTIDLSAWAGTQVEVSIAYVSDWSIQGLGTFIDDIEASTGEGSTSFEAGLDGWAVSGAAPGSGPNTNDLIRTTAAGFPEGAVIATEDTLYFGFGFEGIAGSATRAAIMDRAMEYLLR